MTEYADRAWQDDENLRKQDETGGTWAALNDEGSRMIPPEKIHVRLGKSERDLLVQWATDMTAAHPPLKGVFFRMNGEPKVSTILRHAAMREVGTRQ